MNFFPLLKIRILDSSTPEKQPGKTLKPNFPEDTNFRSSSDQNRRQEQRLLLIRQLRVETSILCLGILSDSLIEDGRTRCCKQFMNRVRVIRLEKRRVVYVNTLVMKTNSRWQCSAK
ncbi:hypothetical protein NDU88_001776 [Pleurodeles waltl]|uniref:Uncharacterized protein n=1 Tax=Pleurodeles waltl TaxID=8319 RepID=A0AAV7LAR8_PLEWA|nr:hypothetical protein NDU88_001776 [Pleurodeles waltl]